MKLRNLALATAVAAFPLTASAVSFDAMNNVAPGSDNTLTGAPYFFDASFEDSDEAGVFDFTFTNLLLDQAAVTISQGTVLQNTLDFMGGVTVSWLDDGASAFIAEGAGPQGFSLSTVIAQGASDTLRVDFGDPTANVATGRGDIDFSIKVQPIPLPASILMLLAAMGGVAFLGRRRVV